MLRALAIAGALIVAGAAVYVRLAPSDPQRWHVSLEFSENKDFKGGVQRVAAIGPDGLARFDALARATPRVKVLAGSVAEGHITYVARSAFWGFPDYITAQQDGDALRIYARLRFGRSDFGVNGDRVDRWLGALETG